MGWRVVVVALSLALVACMATTAEPEVSSEQPDAGEADGTVVLDTGEACTCGSDAPATVSLECVCAFTNCQSFDELAVVEECSVPGQTLTSGCGELRVGTRNRGGLSTWVFDAETHELVAVHLVDDSPWGPCRVGTYVTPGYEAECADAATCSRCTDEENVCELP